MQLNRSYFQLIFSVLALGCKPKRIDSSVKAEFFEDPATFKNATFEPEAIVPGVLPICLSDIIWEKVTCMATGFLISFSGHILTADHVTDWGIDGRKLSSYDLDTINNPEKVRSYVVFPGAFKKINGRVYTGRGFLADLVVTQNVEDMAPIGSTLDFEKQQDFPKVSDFSILKIRGQPELDEFLKWAHPIPITKEIPADNEWSYLVSAARNYFLDNFIEVRNLGYGFAEGQKNTIPLDYRYGVVNFKSGQIKPGTNKESIVFRRPTEKNLEHLTVVDGESGSPMINNQGEVYSLVWGTRHATSIEKIYDFVDLSKIDLVQNTKERSDAAKIKFQNWHTLLTLNEDKDRENEKKLSQDFTNKIDSKERTFSLTGDSTYCWLKSGKKAEVNNMKVKVNEKGKFEFSFGFSWIIGWTPWVSLEDDIDLSRHYHFINGDTGEGGLRHVLLGKSKKLSRYDAEALLKLLTKQNYVEVPIELFSGTKFATSKCD